jgi:hypothetical protein
VIRDRLAEIWREELAIKDRQPMQGHLLDIPNIKAYAGLEPGTDRRFLVFRLTAEQQRAAKKTKRLRSTKGIKTSDGGTDGLVVMIEQPGIPAAVFPAVAADVLAVIAAAEPGSAVRLAFDRFNSWQAALERNAGPMTAREVRGAIGELIVLTELLVPTLGLHRSLARWTALGDAPLHDFGGEGWVLEVKTALSPSPTFRVSHLGQLEPDPPSTPVRLVVVELESLAAGSSAGLSLNDAMARLESQVAGDSTVLSALRNALVKRGLRSPAIEAEANTKYSVRSTLCFAVENGFPIIRKASLPLGISDASYDVQIHECLSFRILPDQLKQTISECEGEL